MTSEKEKNIIWKNPLVWVCLVAIGYWLYTYHWHHAMGFLPYLIILLCPLMHLFMHGHHHDSKGGTNQEDQKAKKDNNHAQ